MLVVQVLILISFLSFLTDAHPLDIPHRRRACSQPHTDAANGSPSALHAATTPTPNTSGGSRVASSVKTKPTISSTTKLVSLQTSLFPVSNILSFWTTAPGVKGARPLSDATLRPTNEIKALSHAYVLAPDGQLAMKAHYPKGSYNFQHNPMGGFSFHGHGPPDLDLSKAREATLGYSVFFEKGFQFQEGGKLPGLFGGVTEEDAGGCGGGSRNPKCFSTRLMWRHGGAGEFYTYLPPGHSQNNKLCHVSPASDCNPVYGASVGRGAFHFKAGEWTTVAQRILLNTPGKADGAIELFVNGQSVIHVEGIILRETDANRFRGIMMQTFFGGSTPNFASPKSQNTYFRHFSVAITKKL